VLFIVVAASLRSQTRAAPATLDFVAETPDHRPVLNLRADEIVLKEDGVVKPLKSFQPLFSGELQIRRSRDAGNRFSGSVVALLDASFFLAPTVGPSIGAQPISTAQAPVNTTAEAVKSTVTKFLKKLTIESPVAVYSSNLNLKIIRDFSGPRGEVIQEPPEKVKAALDLFQKKMITDRSAIHLIGITGVEEFELAQIESVADHVADLPGRKAVIWYCDELNPLGRFPDRSGRLYDARLSMLSSLQRSGVSIYPISCFTQKLFRLADLPGGRYYRDYDQLSAAVHDALRDGRSSYGLSWDATNAANANPAHRIEIVCKRKDVQLLYPHLYLDYALPQDEASRLKAVERPYNSTLAVFL
jgi:hypothetical protein